MKKSKALLMKKSTAVREAKKKIMSKDAAGAMISLAQFMVEQNKNKPLRKLDRPYRLEQFEWVIPAEIIEQVMTKRDVKRFWKWMSGQTVMSLKEQAGVYASDLRQYLAGGENLD